MERALARWPGPLLLRRARAPTREPPFPRSGQAQSAGLSVHQEPRWPRIVNAWTEEVEELPWSSTPSGGSPDVSRLPRAATLLPGLGRSHHLESSTVQDLEPATPAPSSSIIHPQTQGTPARGPTGQAGPKDWTWAAPDPAWRGVSSPPPRPL
ncbi:unnamed protein product, partial [Rangifer tarandus platyrhynchus]